MIKKIIITLLFSCFFASVGFCDLSEEQINLYNLKKDGMYLFNLESNVEKIDVSDSKIVNVTPIVSVESNGRQLFVEANDTGVCDVLIKTQDKEYKLRFIAGNVFEDEKDDLTIVDLPAVMSKEI